MKYGPRGCLKCFTVAINKLPIIIIVVHERCLAVQFLPGKILDIMEDVPVYFVCCFLRRAPSGRSDARPVSR